MITVHTAESLSHGKVGEVGMSECLKVHKVYHYSQKELEEFESIYGCDELVLCKDCKHRPIKEDDFQNGFDLDFPDGKCPCQCDDGWYSWYPSDDWFCANGERS